MAGIILRIKLKKFTWTLLVDNAPRWRASCIPTHRVVCSSSAWFLLGTLHRNACCSHVHGRLCVSMVWSSLPPWSWPMYRVRLAGARATAMLVVDVHLVGVLAAPTRCSHAPGRRTPRRHGHSSHPGGGCESLWPDRRVRHTRCTPGPLLSVGAVAKFG